MEVDDGYAEDTVCCDWCGEMVQQDEMATAELCGNCYEVAD